MDTLIAAKALFGLYALAVFGGGLLAVFAKSLVRAMVGLILTLFGVSGMYLLMNAPFIAFMQLLIYVGAVVILIFFAIMLTKAPAGKDETEKTPFGQKALAILAAGLPAVVLGTMVTSTPQVTTGQPKEVPIRLLGQGLMEDYVLAFELISVVLLVAMAGAVLLAWKRREEG